VCPILRFCQRSLVGYFYCDYRDQKLQSTENIIGAILKQAITAAKYQPSDIIDRLVRDLKQGRKKLGLEDILLFLHLILKNFDSVYICIDARDECAEENRWNLIDVLCRLASSTDDRGVPRRIKVMFIGRTHMEQYVNSHPFIVRPNYRSVILRANTADISGYVTYKLMTDTRVTFDENFKKQIVEGNVSTADGMSVCIT
jgi:hypothetical protein